MIRLAPISTRNQFGPLLVSLGIGEKDRAVEIGTHRADFASILLDSWPGHLTCVDPWSVPAGYEDQAEMLLHLGGKGDREQDLFVATARLAQFGDRVRLLRKLSEDAADEIAPRSLGFVYLDGDHRLEAVLTDLKNWWPKLRSGGVMAGHDWLCPGTEDGNWGRFVQPAVSYATIAFNNLGRPLDLHVIAEEGGLPWSFYLIKP